MITVTGATGHLGRLVVADLLQRGVPATEITAAVRTPDKAIDLGVAVRHADLDQPETLADAFAGTDKLLLISTNGPDDLRIAQHRAAVAAAREAKVGQIVYTSIVNAAQNPIALARVHRTTEGVIQDAGLPYVFLRNNWYFENHTATLSDAVARGGLVGSAGNGRIAAATRADYAAAAAAVLTTDGHEGAAYELTGETAWTLAEFAAEVSKQTGKEISYTDLPPEQYQQILLGAGLPDFFAEVLVDADLKIAGGALAEVTPDLSKLIGRPATSLADAVSAALQG